MPFNRGGLLFLFFLIFFISIKVFSQDTGNEFKIKIRQVEIELPSNSIYDKSYIESLIKSINDEYLDLGEINNDITRIKKFYFDNGYFDTEVDTLITINYKSKLADVKFVVNENNQYKVNKISIAGLENLSAEITKNIYDNNKILLKQGDRYIRNNVSQEIFRIINILNNFGYADAYFEPPEITKVISSNPALANKVNISIKVNRQYRIKNIKISVKNNKHSVPDTDFWKEIDIKENDLYSKEKIIEIENKINRITIVEYARLQVNNVDTISNYLDLILNVNLKDKYELKPELFGYDINNRFYAGIGLSFSDRYFLGSGRTETTDIRLLAHSANVNVLEMNFQLYQPYLFNNYKIRGNWNLKADLFTDEVYKISEIKNDFQVIYDLPIWTYVNNLIFDWKVSNERFNVKNTTSVISNDTSVILTPDIFVNIFSSVLGATVLHNSTDDFLFPTKGFIQTFVVEESGALGNLLKKYFSISTFGYVKFTNLNKFFINLSGATSKSVLAKKFLLGMIFEYGDNRLYLNNQTVDVSVFPLEARFIGGGGTSVRGWAAKKLGTFDGKENGGNFLLEGSFEHRTRPFIESKGFFKDLGFVTFLDYGNLWKEVKFFKLSEIDMAIGFGIRYYTIVGPIRFDLGFKLYDYNPDIGTDKWLFNNDFSTIFKNKFEFQFGIGQTF